VSDKPQDDVLTTYKDFDTLLKLLREGERPTGLGEKQNFKGDVLAMAAHLLEKTLDKDQIRDFVEKEIKALHGVSKFERFRLRIYLMLFLVYSAGRNSVKVEDDFPYEKLVELLRSVPAEQLEPLRPKAKPVKVRYRSK
jgi:hypothetical protein